MNFRPVAVNGVNSNLFTVGSALCLLKKMTESIRSKELYMNNRNYQRELDALITGFEKKTRCPGCFFTVAVRPAPAMYWNICHKYFEITVFFYNPNIAPKEEYAKRVAEIRRHDRRDEF